MTSGSNTYRAFKDQRAVLERQAREHTDAMHNMQRVMQTSVQHQSELWKRLATVHLNANLELPVSVRKSMDARHSKIEAGRAQVERIKTALSSLKRKRSAVTEHLENLKSDLDAAKEAISIRFEADARVVEARRRLAELKVAHDLLADKRQRAVKELNEKRGAHEHDEFFAYLRGRGYGTASYSAWLPLTRMLDAALARVTNYREENANYERLMAVPAWVEERISALGPDEKVAEAAFAMLEREFFAELDPKRDEVTRKNDELRKLDDEIEGENQDIASMNKFLSDAAIAQDAELKRIIDDFTEILRNTRINDLKRLAAQSSDPEDDKIVAELQLLTDENAELTKKVDLEKDALYHLERKIKSFEVVEKHLKRKGWNDSDHKFTGVDPDFLSTQLSKDAFTAAIVIGMLNDHHREPPRHETSYGSSHTGGSSYGSNHGSTSNSDSFGGSGSFSTSNSFGGDSSYSTTDSF